MSYLTNCVSAAIVTVFAYIGARAMLQAASKLAFGCSKKRQRNHIESLKMSSTKSAFQLFGATACSVALSRDGFDDPQQNIDQKKLAFDNKNSSLSLELAGADLPVVNSSFLVYIYAPTAGRNQRWLVESHFPLETGSAAIARGHCVSALALPSVTRQATYVTSRARLTKAAAALASKGERSRQQQLLRGALLLFSGEIRVDTGGRTKRISPGGEATPRFQKYHSALAKVLLCGLNARYVLSTNPAQKRQKIQVLVMEMCLLPEDSVAGGISRFTRGEQFFDVLQTDSCLDHGAEDIMAPGSDDYESQLLAMEEEMRRNELERCDSLSSDELSQDDCPEFDDNSVDYGDDIRALISSPMAPILEEEEELDSGSCGEESDIVTGDDLVKYDTENNETFCTGNKRLEFDSTKSGIILDSCTHQSQNNTESQDHAPDPVNKPTEENDVDSNTAETGACTKCNVIAAAGCLETSTENLASVQQPHVVVTKADVHAEDKDSVRVLAQSMTRSSFAAKCVDCDRRRGITAAATEPDTRRRSKNKQGNDSVVAPVTNAACALKNHNSDEKCIVGKSASKSPLTSLLSAASITTSVGSCVASDATGQTAVAASDDCLTSANDSNLSDMGNCATHVEVVDHSSTKIDNSETADSLQTAPDNVASKGPDLPRNVASETPHLPANVASKGPDLPANVASIGPELPATVASKGPDLSANGRGLSLPKRGTELSESTTVEFDKSERDKGEPEAKQRSESRPEANYVKVTKTSIDFFGARAAGSTPTACCLSGQMRCLNAPSHQRDKMSVIEDGDRCDLELYVKLLEGLAAGKSKVYVKATFLHPDPTYKRLKRKTQAVKSSSQLQLHKHILLPNLRRNILSQGRLVVAVWSHSLTSGNKQMCKCEIDMAYKLDFPESEGVRTSFAEKLLASNKTWNTTTLYMS